MEMMDEDRYNALLEESKNMINKDQEMRHRAMSRMLLIYNKGIDPGVAKWLQTEGAIPGMEIPWQWKIYLEEAGKMGYL